MKDDDFDELLRQLSSGRAESNSWEDVLGEFQALGRTLEDLLFRKALQVQAPDADSILTRLRAALTTATQELNDVVDGTPEAARARDEFRQVTDSLRTAVSRATDEVRPELLRMLRQANGELRRRSGLDEV